MRTKNFIANSNIRGSFALAAMALAVASCSTDVESAAPSIESNLTKITLGATMSADTRVDVSGLTTKWSSGTNDFLYVYGADETFAIDETNSSKTNSASFSGELDLTTPQYIYAVCDPSDGDIAYLTENAAGEKEYAMVLQTSQDQNTYESGAINSGSIGNEIMLYGVSANEVSAESTDVAITMKHAMAVQDFAFSNITSLGNGIISKLEFVSSESFLSTATLNLDNGVITPGESTAETITVTVNPGKLSTDTADDTNIYNVDEMTVRVAMLPQTVAASAEWSVIITLYDGAKYIKEFGAGSEEYTYVAGDCASIAIDCNDMTEIVPDAVEGVSVTLQSITAENTADSDVWNVACGTVAVDSATASDFDQCFDVLAAAVAEDRNIKLVFTDLTKTSTIFKGVTTLTDVEFSAVTTMASASTFEGCTNLKSVSAPKCTKFHNKCFFNCANLETVYGPKVNTLGANVFIGCTSLATLEVGTDSSVSSIGNCASTTFGDDLSKIELTTRVGSKSQNEDGETWDWSVDDSNTYTGFKSITIVE